MKGIQIILGVALALVMGLGAIIPAQISDAQSITSQVSRGALLAAPDHAFLAPGEELLFSAALEVGDIIEWDWDVDPYVLITFRINLITDEGEEFTWYLRHAEDDKGELVVRKPGIWTLRFFNSNIIGVLLDYDINW